MDLQQKKSRLFLKNIKNFLCKQKYVNNRIIPSMHAKRKITICSHNHSFTPYPSFSPYGQTDRITDRGTNTLPARGLEELFSSCAVVSVFGSGGKQVLILHTYVLRVQYSCGVMLVFWFWREIVFGVRYVLSVQYSCAAVSVFWLWREIVHKMRTLFYKKIILVYFILIRQPMCVFHKTYHSFTLNLSILYLSLVPCRSTS